MYYLAIDLGAGSGRGIVYYLDKNRLQHDEVYRFKDYAVKNADGMYWDMPLIFESVKNAITCATDKGYNIGAIGIDSWGVDYAVIRKDGGMDMPYHYRDKRTKGIIDIMNDNVIPTADSYNLSGIAPNEFNTLYQLYCGMKSGQFDNAKKILFIPNAIGYLLTGVAATEPTIASTSGFYHKKRGYILELLNKIGFNPDLLPTVMPTGSLLGSIKSDIMLELGLNKSIDVILTCGHDTAAAIACCEGSGEDSLFLSSGTWSLFGSVVDDYVVSEDALCAGYTNELGVKGVRLLKNIIGMWIIQECMRKWTKEDSKFSYYDIDTHLADMRLGDSLINVGDADFLAPDDMTEAISAYLCKTNQNQLSGRYEIAQCIYTSLALEYRYSLEELEKISNKSHKSINIFGGGSKNALLSQLTADSLKMNVSAGVTEASSSGNAIIQMMSNGEINSLKHASTIIANTYSVINYYPRKNKKLDELYLKYKELKSIK